MLFLRFEVAPRLLKRRLALLLPENARPVFLHNPLSLFHILPTLGLVHGPKRVAIRRDLEEGFLKKVKDTIMFSY